MIETVTTALEARPLAEQAVRALAEQTAELAAMRAADLTATRVVEGVFLHLGVDIKDEEQKRSLRESLAFLVRMHKGAGEVKSAIIKTCVGALVTGILAAIWIGITAWPKTHP